MTSIDIHSVKCYGHLKRMVVIFEIWSTMALHIFMSRYRKLYVMCSTLFFIGCQNTSMPKPTTVAYLTKQPLHLRVNEIEIVKNYTHRKNATHVEHYMTTPPHATLMQWVRDRLQAEGGNVKLRISIEDASIVEKQLSPERAGLWTIYASEDYHGLIKISLAFVNNEERVIVAHEIYARAMRSAFNHDTLQQRMMLWQSLTESMIDDIDFEVERLMGTTLRTYYIENKIHTR